MLGTSLDLLRFAASMVFGLPFQAPSLDRLVGAVLETRRSSARLDPKETSY